jgi:alkylhydroperoxidase/carboxymuconolactone decarboxylase family protein YurZ
MAPPPKLTPVEYLTTISAPAAEAFQSLRKAVLAAGPLDPHTCELIALGALVTTGNEASFKTHARRLLKEGVSVAALRHAVLVTFGATTTFSLVSDGLHWIDDVAGSAG